VFRPCIVVPTYDNPRTIAGVVRAVREHLSDVLVVDDASGEEARAVIDGLERDGLARVRRRDANGGKGAAVKTGLVFAQELGFTHALQIDADGQHASDDVPRFLDAARDNPSALVLGQPRFDASAPIGRRVARRITIFWTALASGGVIGDPMCGFRVYPVDTAVAAGAIGDRMDFDPEIAVRIAWTGAPVVHVPTNVRYERGGVSHFKLVLDNWLIARMHSRLMTHRVKCFVLRRPLAYPSGERALPAPRT
jgi:glycosyltransferase involved in cell wall biosynthesis